MNEGLNVEKNVDDECERGKRTEKMERKRKEERRGCNGEKEGEERKNVPRFFLAVTQLVNPTLATPLQFQPVFERFSAITKFSGENL